jgi:poly-gamma-glutamate synthesis protein (capsule biosynthesis protein)
MKSLLRKRSTWIVGSIIVAAGVAAAALTVPHQGRERGGVAGTESRPQDHAVRANQVLSTPSTSPSAPASPRHFTVLGAGDILLHSPLWRVAQADAKAAHKSGYYFDPIFASAKPDISGADLAICHMETPYGKPNGPFTGYPIFEVPPSIATTIHNVGYDSCSTASNHSLDGGEAGIDRTLDALDAAGVKHTGTARSAAEAATPDLLQANGVTVAQLSYAFGFNGLKRPADKP